MGTTAQKLQAILDSKAAIKAAIVAKSPSVQPTDVLSSFTAAIASISGAAPKPEQSKTVTPTAAGLTVTPDTGYALSSVVVNGDADLVASNVKSGIEIFGVTGNLQPAKEEQSKTVTPTAAGLTVTPDTGKVLSSVVVNGDADLVAENIKKDVDIFGVTGSYEGGGGGSGSATVRFLDHDGTVLHSYTTEEAQALTEMPALPTATGLTCQGWNYTLQQMKNCVNAVDTCDVGATYVTDDGKTRVNLTVRDPKFTTVKLILKQTISEGVSIDWGDGSSATTWSGTSNTTSTHVYSPSAYPTSYTILISVNSGELTLVNMNLAGLGSAANNETNHRDAVASMLDSVNIGSGVTSIDSYAFNACYSLLSITIPSSVTSIASYAFSNCFSLQSITIPSGVTRISDYAFYYCLSLTSLTIPSRVTYIGGSAFYYCLSLTSLTIPSGITSISTGTFYQCCSLQSITIPSGVTSIGNNTFYNCYSLQSITIPSSVTSIGNSTFYNCYSLQSITIPSGVTGIGGYAFYSCLSLTSLTIPSRVTYIGASAFYYCYSLQSITIPSSVTSISSSAFQNCYSLQSITIPPRVTSINNNTFYHCYSLQSITIPSSVTSIARYAFSYCTGVLTYDFRRSVSVPTLANVNAFNTTPTVKEIVVPDSLYDDWIAASNWSSTTNNIVNCIVKASESSLGSVGHSGGGGL